MRIDEYKIPCEPASVVVPEMKFRKIGRTGHLSTMTSVLGLAVVFREFHTARTESVSAIQAVKKETRFAMPSAIERCH
jgi:hypothetical protein